MNFILKWLGVTSLKAALGWIATKYIVKPVVGWLGDRLQEAVNDPETTTDEEFVEHFKVHAVYVIDKRLAKIF